jgi:hypothetical protein
LASVALTSLPSSKKLKLISFFATADGTAPLAPWVWNQRLPPASSASVLMRPRFLMMSV